MEYRRLGSSGLKVSAISIGAWLTYGSNRIDFDASAQCLRAAVEQGINFIDVADIYAYGRAEEVVGKVLKDFKRSDLVISTKAFWPMSDNINDKGLSRKHLFESVHKSLRRFEVDYIDLFFCHRFDDETPVEETVRALDDLVRQGKILYWGTSMWEAPHIRSAVQSAQRVNAYRPVTEQPLYNMLDRQVVEGDLEKTCLELGIGLVVWSPLAQGVLTGKYNNGVPEDSRAKNVDLNWFSTQISEERLQKVRGITALAEEMGTTTASLALAWAMKNQAVSSVITGATKPAHVAENLKALDVKITPEIDARIEAILQNKPPAVG
ncbi:MAG: aldo/keto reductase family protein [Chloroflexi bacterium]|nr:aldo/keto reductase family protein [Chloroflexota bacterium]